jgi:hypothetical protein
MATRASIGQKKTTMKTFFGTILLIFATFNIQAQQTDSISSQPKRERELSAEQRALRKYRLMRSEISMDQDQADQIKKVLVMFEQEKEQLLSGQEKGSPQQKSAMKALREKCNKSLEEVMGSEKFAQWEKIRQEKSLSHKSKTQPNKAAPEPSDDYY